MPANLSPTEFIYAYRGGAGGSEGGRGSRYDDDPSTPRLPAYLSDPNYGSYELSTLSEHNETPQGNIGGGNHRPHNEDRNAGGGGGGAGAAGQSGVWPGRGGHGGIGVAAFGNDTGIPSDYGTSGPTNATTGTRWFGGGGQGGDSYVPPLSYVSLDGRFGGGGISVPDNSQNSTYNRTAKTNTGGGGAGARTFNPYLDPKVELAGAGGSGIVVIRYQAQL